MFIRRQFLEKLSGTSEIPQGFIPSRAKGEFIYDSNGIAYLDLLSGFSVMNLGHSHSDVIDAIQWQSKKYLHTNVYAEHLQAKQIQLADMLTSLLPSSLNAVYYLSSGSETIDAAIKISRKYTNRTEIIACRNAYHGSTLAAESLRSDDEHSRVFRPLIPGIKFIQANKISDLEFITSKTAAVIIEIVQAEAGVFRLEENFLNVLKKKCEQTETLLIVDEIQTGFGRTGQLFAFQDTNIVPNILLLGKAFGCGLPLSALVSSRSILNSLNEKPALGYISTFGGNPLSCAAAFAGLKALLQEKIIESIPSKVEIIKSEFSKIKNAQLRAEGLLVALDFGDSKKVWKLIMELFKNQIIVESFLFRPEALRIAPPLMIGEEILKNACKEIVALAKKYT